MIRIIAVSGNKNSGKTTLCRKLLNELRAMGIRVGYIKRTSDEVVSKTKTDSGSVSEMGIGTAIWGNDGLRCEFSLSERINPHFIASTYFSDSELIILEGGKNLSLPKIWVRTEGEEQPRYPGIMMIYDREGKRDNKLVCCAGEEKEMASRLASMVRGKSYRSTKIYFGDSPLPMKEFLSDYIRGSILGMLASLKGGSSNDETIKIYLDGKTEGKK